MQVVLVIFVLVWGNFDTPVGSAWLLVHFLPAVKPSASTFGDCLAPREVVDAEESLDCGTTVRLDFQYRVDELCRCLADNLHEIRRS